MDAQPIQEFIKRWSNSGGAERANYQLFLAELCDALPVARPEPTVDDDGRNAYVFERDVLFDNLDGTHTTRRIDLDKRGCFVLESKQGVLQQDVAPLLSARQQERRAKRKRGFPESQESQEACIRDLGEQLDAHRKRQQELHPGLTMTGMYNVLAKLRAGQRLTGKEPTIHEQGLVSVLRQIHDELDAAAADAYGWPVDLSDEEILERLVALNHQRADEERRGLIRWLRPEFQNPDGRTQQAIGAAAADSPAKAKKAEAQKQSWPKSLSAQAAAVQSALAELAAPADEVEIAKRYTGANKDRIAELLETLSSLGKARQLDDGRYVPV